jgi:glyoxylase-like metal-dependent hydrolase (beta-lactamase superfamily II)
MDGVSISPPGHTPESVCLLVSDLRRGPEPWFLLTGDTMFVGAVGRPDLPGRARENARDLHDSLTQRLLPLPDMLEVYPAHFSGSVCGAGMSGKPTTTLAFEKRWNPLLSLGREELVNQVSEGIPEKPAEMGAILRFNQGRAP